MRPRPLSCQSVALIIEVRLGWRPHRHTVRYWADKWLVQGDTYLRTPGRFLIYRHGIDAILEKLANTE